MLAYMVVMMVKFAEVMNFSFFGKRYDYTDADKAAGKHCIDRFRDTDSPLSLALKARIGKQVDDRVSLSMGEALVGSLQQDGTHDLTVLYQINRIGKIVLPTKKAMGTLVNSNCSVKLTVFQR